MQVFISSSTRSKKWAEDLADELRRGGFSPWLDFQQLLPGTHWRQKTEEVLRDSKYVIALFDSPGEVDAIQQRTITEVLNAMWQDDGKRLVPVLLRDARLPAYMHTAVPDAAVHALRVKNPRTEWKDAVSKLVTLIREDRNLVDTTLGEVVQPGRLQRRHQAQRLSYIGGAAERMKTRRPASPLPDKR